MSSDLGLNKKLLIVVHEDLECLRQRVEDRKTELLHVTPNIFV